MRILLCIFAIVLTSRSFAQPELLPLSALERVPMIAAEIDPAKPETLADVEERLVALDKAGLRTVQQLYLANRIALQEAKEQGRWLDAWHLQARVRVFGQAYIRLQTGLNPPELIRDWMRKEGYEEPLPILLSDPALDRAFPRHYLFSASSPLPANPGETAPPHLFAVARDGAVIQLSTFAELRGFFLANLPQLRSLATRVKGQPPGNLQDASRNALRIWLCLSQALHGDGYFRFTPLEKVAMDEQPGDRKTGPTLRATGSVEALPDAGNRGEISATLEFRTNKYLLTDIRETAELHPGFRPDIDQLLAPDPAARRKAEQHLLQMGPMAFDYLMAVRTKAAPELQQAIDETGIRIMEQVRKH